MRTQLRDIGTVGIIVEKGFILEPFVGKDYILLKPCCFYLVTGGPAQCSRSIRLLLPIFRPTYFASLHMAS